MNTQNPRKSFRQVLSLLLCCLLITGCLGVAAYGAEDQEPQTPDEDFVIDREPEPDEFPPTEIVPGEDLDEPDEPGEDGEGDGADEPSGEPNSTFAPLEPEDETVTVRYNMGEFGLDAETVVIGQCPENVPEIPEQEAWTGYVVLGWYNSVGEQVDPAEVPVTDNTIYTARWVRDVDLLMITDEHKAYVNGLSNGMFEPNRMITRAEAATMFTNLLRTKDFEHSPSFSDVKAGDWFADAVGCVSALGIANGYSDGRFKPNARITRSEFLKMATSCSNLEEGSCTFRDVPENHWARPYIAVAYSAGWVSGDPNGAFRPDDYITRTEAVKIINKMLGREPDSSIVRKTELRNFCDVFTDFWGYYQILEASNGHTFRNNSSGDEEWVTYTHYPEKTKAGWLRYGGKLYRVGDDGKFLRGGEYTFDGRKYRFDSAGVATTVTGFYTVGEWKRYYKDGVIVEDISNLGVVSGPYYIKVYKPANYLIVFAKDETGKYNIPVRSMLTSCGNPTPTGDFYTPGKYRWLEMVGGSWAQWCTQIMDSYLFHSVPNDLHTNDTMWVSEYNNLGTTRSLGCIRLNCEDAKWIYDNCVLGTHVYISPTETKGPLDKPAGLKLPAGHSWDPTDPTAYYLCKRYGCH